MVAAVVGERHPRSEHEQQGGPGTQQLFLPSLQGA